MSATPAPAVAIRRSAERGHADHGWLNSYFSFSFAEYHDPAHMEFGALRVINDDRIAAGTGFGTHAHRDMEILTYILAGTLEHQDSTGAHYLMRPGDVQRMSAGRGVQHSEFNPSADEPVHLLQVWIRPNVTGIPAEYEQLHFPAADKRGRLRLLASPDRAAASLLLHQDARVYAGLIDGAEIASLELRPGRRAYVHAARGSVIANGTALAAGDAVMLTGADRLELSRGQDAEVLVFDLA